VEICLLGSLVVLDDFGVPVAVPGRRVQLLLAALALRCGETLSDDHLVDALWGEDVPSGRANALQRQVSRLRTALGTPDLIARRGGGYTLVIDPSAVDIARFDGLASRGHEAMRVGDALRAHELLEEALSIWRGDPLVDFAYEEFAQGDIARLAEARLVATEVRIDADLALGRDVALISELEQLVGAYPLREHLHAQLMLALSRSGRQAEALRAYQRARDVLGEELGLQPSAELRDLEAAILQQHESVVRRESDARQSRARTNLRTPLTAMIGRDQEMDALRPILQTRRLVTLVGPGGVGKSRLALEAAREWHAAADGEAWFVELAETTDPNDVVSAIVGTLDIPRGGSARADLPRLIEYLKRRAALLVLDNCEHLIAAVARAAHDVLESCPAVRICATSREGLAVPGEVVWPVAPLALDDAVTLFLERGLAADPATNINDESPVMQRTLADVCARLDGLPLAIELAAARLRAMPIEELAKGLEDRFRMLTRGARTALPRQQTLRAVVDWSYDLLFDDERTVFDRLSVFGGSCSLAAARAVCADEEITGDDVAELIARLVDKSLVLIERDKYEGYARCHMLQTLVDYGRDRLEQSGDASRLYGAHLRYFADLASRSIVALYGYKQRGWLRAVAANLTNLRAALDAAVGDGDAETAYCIAGSLGWYWWATGRGLEASQWLALARTCAGDVSDVARARVLAWRVFADSPGFGRWGEAGAAHQSRRPNVEGFLSLGETEELSRQAVALYAGDRRAQEELAGVEIALSVTFSTLGALPYASELLEDAERRLAAADRTPVLGAMQAFAAGRLAFVEDRYRDAEESFRLSVDGFTANAVEIHRWLALRLAARLAEVRGDHAFAIEALERAVVIARSLGMAGSVNLLLGDLGESLGAAGEFDRARDVLTQPLAAAREVGFVRGVCESLAGLAVTEWRAGEPDRAASVAAAGLDSARQIDHFEAATFCLVILGWAAGQRGDLHEARTRHVEALRCAQDATLPRSAAFALEGLAALAMLEDDGREAAWLLGAASTLRAAPGAAVGVAFAVGARGESEQVLAAARRAVGGDTVVASFAEGARTPDAVASALLAAGAQRPES